MYDAEEPDDSLEYDSLGLGFISEFNKKIEDPNADHDMILEEYQQVLIKVILPSEKINFWLGLLNTDGCKNKFANQIMADFYSFKEEYSRDPKVQLNACRVLLSYGRGDEKKQALKDARTYQEQKISIEDQEDLLWRVCLDSTFQDDRDPEEKQLFKIIQSKESDTEFFENIGRLVTCHKGVVDNRRLKVFSEMTQTRLDGLKPLNDPLDKQKRSDAITNLFDGFAVRSHEKSPEGRYWRMRAFQHNLVAQKHNFGILDTLKSNQHMGEAEDQLYHTLVDTVTLSCYPNADNVPQDIVLDGIFENCINQIKSPVDQEYLNKTCVEAFGDPNKDEQLLDYLRTKVEPVTTLDAQGELQTQTLPIPDQKAILNAIMSCPIEKTLSYRYADLRLRTLNVLEKYMEQEDSIEGDAQHRISTGTFIKAHHPLRSLN
jgi:hypothetical protein